MIRYGIIALGWLVVFGGIALLVAVVERRRHERKARIYERNFAGMGFDAPDKKPGAPEPEDGES